MQQKGQCASSESGPQEALHASACSLTQLCFLILATLLPHCEKVQASLLANETLRETELSHLS